MKSQSPVLILGAGINGSALARELVLNRVPVVVVDTRDLAAGTTAYSSRLIHGGLRYLEYGDFDLVRESLAERTRWLRLAPHLVRPLRLFIPLENRWGGFASAHSKLSRHSPEARRAIRPETARPMDRPRGFVALRSLRARSIAATVQHPPHSYRYSSRCRSQQVSLALLVPRRTDSLPREVYVRATARRAESRPGTGH